MGRDFLKYLGFNTAASAMAYTMEHSIGKTIFCGDVAELRPHKIEFSPERSLVKIAEMLAKLSDNVLPGSNRKENQIMVIGDTHLHYNHLIEEIKHNNDINIVTIKRDGISIEEAIKEFQNTEVVRPDSIFMANKKQIEIPFLSQQNFVVPYPYIPYDENAPKKRKGPCKRHEYIKTEGKWICKHCNTPLK